MTRTGEVFSGKINPRRRTAPWSCLFTWRFTFDLYLYETSNAPHTKTFQFIPTDYVDITDVIKKKLEAAYQHKSQGAAEWMEMYVTMARVHGYEADVTFAEGYVKARNSSGLGGRPGAAGKTLAPTKCKQPAEKAEKGAHERRVPLGRRGPD